MELYLSQRRLITFKIKKMIDIKTIDRKNNIKIVSSLYLKTIEFNIN